MSVACCLMSLALRFYVSQLKSLLENEYKTLDCFRKENARRQAEAKEKAKSGAAALPPTAPAAPAAVVEAAKDIVGAKAEAAVVEKSVRKVLEQGFRTPDLARGNKEGLTVLSTKEMGAKVRETVSTLLVNA